MKKPPRIAPAKIVQVMLLEALAIGSGVLLWVVTGRFAWLVVGVVGGTAVTVTMLLLPLLRAAREDKGGQLVE